MNDNIVFRKIWQDNELIELKVVCSSSVAAIKTQIYVSDLLIDELIYLIQQFLGGKSEEVLWANEDKGDNSSACISLRFIKKDKLGHILVEVFAELDDGGSYVDHNCCFFVNTEYGMLLKFCNSLVQLKNNLVGYEVILNKI